MICTKYSLNFISVIHQNIQWEVRALCQFVNDKLEHQDNDEHHHSYLGFDYLDLTQERDNIYRFYLYCSFNLLIHTSRNTRKRTF